MIIQLSPEDVPRLVEIAVVPRSVVGWGLKELIQSKEGGTTSYSLKLWIVGVEKAVYLSGV